MDPQSKNTSKDDLQQTSIKLPEMPIPILHRSGKFLYNYNNKKIFSNRKYKDIIIIKI